MLFINKRFCRFSGFFSKTKESLGPLGDMVEQGEEMLSEAQGLQEITKERLFYEMETKGNLQALARQIVLDQSLRERIKLRHDIPGQPPEDVFADDIVTLIHDTKITDAESKVREEMKKNPMETKKILESYHSDLPRIFARFQSKEITREEAVLTAQQTLVKDPIIEKAAQETGLPVDALAAGAAGVLLDTGKRPQNTWDILAGMKSGMEGLMHFRITKRAAEKMNVKESSIRAVYDINAQKFVRTIQMIKNTIDPNLPGSFISESTRQKIQARLDDPSLDSDERRVLNFLLKDQGNSQELKRLYEYIGGKENIEFTLSEIDKTFEKEAKLEEKPFSPSEIRRKSQNYFREHVSVGSMLKCKFQLKEDRETLVSYTMASVFRTLPRAFQGQFDLKSLMNIFSDPKSLARFNENLEKTQGLGKITYLKTQIETEGLKRTGKATSEVSAEAIAATKRSTKIMNKAAGAGKYLKWAGPGMLAASEVYNISTGRSTLPESVGRFAGGMLRIVPILGTGLDFADAITGRDQLSGQQLTRTERLSRVGWGVLGALGDIAMIIPGAGIAMRAAISTTRAARIAKGVRVLRTGGLAVGIGAGVVAPLVTSPDMREAVGVTGTIAAKTAGASLGALRLMAGPNGGAMDMDIAMTQIKEKTGSTVKRASEAVADTTENVLKKYDITVATWGAGPLASLKAYFKDPKNLSQLPEVQSALAKDKSKIAELKEIFTDPSLSIPERHKRMKDFIDRSKKSGEK